MAKMWKLLKNPRINEISHVGATPCNLYQNPQFKWPTHVYKLQIPSHEPSQFQSVSVWLLGWEFRACSLFCDFQVQTETRDQNYSLLFLTSPMGPLSCP